MRIEGKQLKEKFSKGMWERGEEVTVKLSFVFLFRKPSRVGWAWLCRWRVLISGQLQTWIRLMGPARRKIVMWRALLDWQQAFSTRRLAVVPWIQQQQLLQRGCSWRRFQEVMGYLTLVLSRIGGSISISKGFAVSSRSGWLSTIALCFVPICRLVGLGRIPDASCFWTRKATPMCSTTTRWGADADAAAKLQNWWIHHLFGPCIHFLAVIPTWSIKTFCIAITRI